MSEIDVTQLARRAQCGDRRAFEDLVHRMVRPALAVAWEFVYRQEDAEDIVQEAFVRAWRNLDRYDAERPFEPWLFTIVRNLARNARRHDRRWTELSLADDVANLAAADEDVDPMEQLEGGERIDALLEQLSPMQRACFRLAELEGFSREEVATMLGVRVGTVRVHIHRARKTLQSLLGADRGGAK